MILVDTSVWVNHLRNGNIELQNLLRNNEVLTHPFIVGELSCGTMRNRREILSLLQELPEARVAEHEEVLGLVERKRLWGHGVGWVDVHLLASALLSSSTIWTIDRHLSRLASSLKLLQGGEN
ncbi:MAG: PIN domain-containing protein [Candidatus Kariarchaeaceae archaeon]